MELKFKVGDRVRIKSIDWYNENKGPFGELCPDFIVFLPSRSKYCGQIMTIKEVLRNSYNSDLIYYKMIEDTQLNDWTNGMIEGLVEEETKPKDMGEVSDEYHTFNELYEYRMLYNAALFNEFAKQGLYDVHKSRKHSDGEYPFGDSNWFIVMAELPTGQISNHYEMKDWDKFQIPEKPVANKWDEHSPRDVANRLISFTTPKKEYPKTYEECIGKLPINWDGKVEGYKCDLLTTFQKLLICRDAYWKIAGEEMGLRKPWKPDWGNNNEVKFIIGVSENEIIKCYNGIAQYILAFPTEEMRDAFYENFKELIESCKELL